MSAETQVVTSAAKRLRDGNPEPRAQCVLVVDKSGSMFGPKIREVNEGVGTLHTELLKDIQATLRVELAIVTFGGGVQVVQDFVSPADFKPPVLTAGGDTPMAAATLRAYELIDQRRARYEASDIDCYGPWVFFVSDGEGTDSDETLAKAAERIRKGEAEKRNKQIAFFAVGVEGANMQQLARLSVREPLKLRGYDFGRMFAWLGQSLRRVSQSMPGDDVNLANPTGPKGWATRNAPNR